MPSNGKNVFRLSVPSNGKNVLGFQLRKKMASNGNFPNRFDPPPPRVMENGRTIFVKKGPTDSKVTKKCIIS